MDNFIDIIRTKAERHKERYRSFDVGVFMRWIGRQNTDWHRWASDQAISALNRHRRCEAWASIQNARRVRYTPEPPDD